MVTLFCLMEKWINYLQFQKNLKKKGNNKNIQLYIQHADKSLLCVWMFTHAVIKMLLHILSTQWDINGLEILIGLFYMILSVTT